jgi:uncharacterized protein
MRHERKTPDDGGDMLVVVFARAPVAGRCKTRLIPALGAAGAARMHRRLVEKTLLTAAATGQPCQLWCAPDSGHGFFRHCRRQHGVALRRQARGDLGRRMSRAIDQSLAAGWRKVLVVGTDCPALSVHDLASAAAALEHRDTVLQPAADGGYVLLGARRPLGSALRGIQWSSGAEMRQTLRRLGGGGACSTLLPVLWDVDHPADLRRARRLGLI